MRVLRTLLRDAFRCTRAKMLTPKCPPRDFRVRARANFPKNRLYRFNGDRRAEMPRKQPKKGRFRGARIFVLCQWLGLAGAPGFEPGITGSKPDALPLGYAPMRSAFERSPRYAKHMAGGCSPTRIGGPRQRHARPLSPVRSWVWRAIRPARPTWRSAPRAWPNPPGSGRGARRAKRRRGTPSTPTW